MNINTLKGLTWLVSAGLAAGLVFYVYDFTQRRESINTPRISQEQAREVFDGAKIPEGPKTTINNSKQVERAFLELNWKGERPPKPVEPKVTQTQPTKVPETPVKDLLTVYMVMEDTLYPDQGRASVQYKPAAKVNNGAKGATLLEELRVGDRLAKPHEYAKVKSITVERGITFVFDDEARSEEDVQVEEYDYEKFIHVVGIGQAPITAPGITVPRLSREAWRPERTTRTKENNYVIGTEDARVFAEDYGGILAREVRHARHRDPKTGKYDGIELKHVEPGGRLAAHGAQSGDVIKSINGHPVTSTSEAITFVKNHQDEYTTWEVVVENKGKTRTIVYESPSGE
ncbi:MAG: hypothetical protein H6828_04445 [Planctomycetes bacterium]|nr:hypothetical protein [Planctomycetota bacterium]